MLHDTMAEKNVDVDNRDHKIGEFSSVELFTKDGLSSIVEATKAVNVFPSGASRDLYCAYPAFGKVVDVTSDRILGLIQKVLQNQNIRGNIQRRQQDEQFELLTECNDVMLEQINSNLDELAGIKKNPQHATVETSIKPNTVNNIQDVGSWNISKSNSSSQSSLLFLTPKNIPRPQVDFKIPVDNNPNKPFEPKIKEKPNSLKPLAILPEYDEDGNIESFLHPYEFELLKFQPPASQLEKCQAKIPKKMENTSFELIEREEQLTKLVYDLRNVNEIAVDVEHHSYRSFQGFSCLIQISTRSKDYVIDGLKLRDELHVLNEIFTNPKILKIFHGADLDVQWLQRDFALYIVNMFDTHQAAKILGLPRLSLAYLLKHFCNIDADKTYQLADWRIRPLPEELISYARQDTHYLIYICELLRNELIKKANDQVNLLENVYQRSTEICKKRYIKPSITSESHMDLYRKSKKIFDNRQLYALKEIFQWRDMISRKEDESYGYALPNHMMLQIAESLPREMQGILACCNPIPPLVRQNLHTLHQIILKARDQPLIKPIIIEQIENRVVNTVDIDNKLYCPHDLSHDTEFRDDLPTLLNLRSDNLNDEDLPTFAEPIISIFEKSACIQEASIKLRLEELKKMKFVTPYERYKAIIPYAEQQKLEEINKQEALKKSIQLCPDKKEMNTTENIKTERNEDIDNMYKLPMKKDLKRKRVKDPSSSNEEVSNRKKEKKSTIVDLEQNNSTNVLHNIKTEQEDSENQTNQLEGSQQSQQGEKEKTDVSIESSNPEQNGISSVKKEMHKRKSNINKYKKNKPLAKVKTIQSSSQPIHFDYSKVDYKQFQGGAAKVQSTELKPKFHGKSKGATRVNKKFNKLFTFTKTNKK